VTLGQLPFGLSVGASVLIPGPHGVAAAAAAGVLLSATETLGGLCFAAWAALDSVLCYRRLKPLLRGLRSRLPRLGAPEHARWTALAAPPAQRRGIIERAYFGGLSHLQITRVLGVGAAS
jgi:hypothetical protein